MKMECLSFALGRGEKIGVWGGMATGKRRRFLKFIKQHRKGNWKEAVDDLEYLTARSEIFHKKEEARLAKIARERAGAAPRSTAVAVIGKSGRSAVVGARPVAGRNGGRAVAGARKQSASPSASDNRTRKPVGKAAAAPKATSKRKVSGQR